MNDSNSYEVAELSLGRTVLEPQDATEIRKWRSSPILGSGFKEFDLSFDPDMITPAQVDYLLARFLELEATPLSGVRAFLSKWASVMGSGAGEASSAGGPSSGQPPLEFAHAVVSMVLHCGLVHGVSMTVLPWLASALAVMSTKRKYRLARCAQLGSERHYVDAVIEALTCEQSQSSDSGGGNQARQTPSGSVGSVSTGAAPETLGRLRAPLDVFKLPLEYTNFEGPTTATPYSAFKGSVQTSEKFYGLSHGSDSMLFLFRHLGKSLRSEIITHLGTEQPAPEAIWDYLDSRFLKTDTSEAASERWEALRQQAGERVDDFYARVKGEWMLFSRVSGVTLPLPFVSAKFVGGLLPEIKTPLEASCGHQLAKLPLEEARDAALFHEAKVAKKTDNGLRKPSLGKRGNGAQQQRASPESLAPAGPRDRPDNEPATSNEPRPNKARCSYCSTNRLRGAHKHDDTHCWKNPANSHLVPEWYRQRQAEASSARGPRSQGDGEGASQQVPATFMVHSTETHSGGLRVVRATAGLNVQVDLLVDSGSDLSLISTRGAKSLGVEISRSHGLQRLESAGSFGSICIIGQARVPITLVDRSGGDVSFNLRVSVADGLNQRLANGIIILGMGTLKRLKATIDTTGDVLYCGALGSAWPLVPYTGTRVAALVADTRLKLPSKAEIDARLRHWAFPKVSVQLKPGAIRPCPKRPYVSHRREMRAMELMVDNLVKAGVVTRLTRAAVERKQVWVSPAFAVPKNPSLEGDEELTVDNVDRAYRLVVDERCINESVQDLLPSWGTYMRSVDECLGELPASDVWYAGLDVGQAFFNLEYEESSMHLFGFSYYSSDGTVQYALFRFMTMGFKLSSFYWAYAIHSLLSTAIPEAYRTDGSTHILAFVDDILAWSRFFDECMRLKNLLVYILEKVNAKAPESKRKGPAREIDYLGLTLLQGGYRVSDSTMSVLRENLGTRPTTLRGLRAKLGLLQFCRSLWRPKKNHADETLAHLTAPFTSLVGSMVSANAKKTARLAWSADLEASWGAISASMGDGFVPFHSEADNWSGMQLVVMSDASPEAGAACLWRLSRGTFADSRDYLSAEWLADHAQLIGLWTHKWSTYERAYDIADRELYAICHALSHWRQLILSFLNFHKLHSEDNLPGVGRVTVFLDSASALGKIEGRLNSSAYRPTTRQTKRWLSWLADLLEYDESDLTYRHVKGKDNSLADLLSRLTEKGQKFVPEGGGDALVLFTSTASSVQPAATPTSLQEAMSLVTKGDFRERLSALQKDDKSTLLHGDTLHNWYEHYSGTAVLGGLAAEAATLGIVTFQEGLIMVISEANISGPVVVPVAPLGIIPGWSDILNTNVQANWTLREWLLFVAHELDYHRPHRDMRDGLSCFVWWPTLLRDAKAWVDQCDFCLEQKPTKRAKLLTAPRVPRGLIDLEARGKHIAIDHGYPSPAWIPAADHEITAFLVLTDIATGYTMVLGVRSVGGEATAEAMFASWVSVFGVPLSVTGDNFIDSSALRTPLAACGVRFIAVPPYSPFSNGSAEERVGRVKRILPSTKLPWDQALPFVQLAINSQKRVSGHSAAELMFGTQVRTPSTAVLATVMKPTSSVSTDDLQAIATSSAVPKRLRGVLERAVGAARISTLQAHVRDCLRSSAARPGIPLKGGELVVWRRPDARPIEGTAILVEGVSVDDGPFCYLGSLAGFTTRLHPLGSSPDHTVSVSACHLEVRHAFVDRSRPTVAVETSIPVSSVKEGDVILAKVSCDTDLIGKVTAAPLAAADLPQDVPVIQVFDSEDGCKFLPVWLSADGLTYPAPVPESPSEDCPLLRTVAKVLMRLQLTPSGKLKESSRSMLVEAGYIEA